MKKLLVHIGYPRAASTWLQTEVFPYVQNYTFLKRQEVLFNLIHPAPAEFELEKLQDLLKSDSSILSEEMILGRFRAGKMNLLFLKEMLGRISKLNIDVRYMIILRDPAELIYSHYNLYIQKGGTLTFKNYLKPSTNLKEEYLICNEFFNFSFLFNSLKDCGITDRLEVFFYDDLVNNPKEFLRELTIRLNLELRIDEININYVNNSYPKTRLKLTRGLNHFTRHGIPFKHYYFHIPFFYNFSLRSKSTAQTVPAIYKKQIEAYCQNYKLEDLREAKRKFSHSKNNDQR